MKTKENITLYICDHCGKKYQVKQAAERHEKYCFKAPENFHKCFQHCIHLIKDKEIYDVGYHYNGSEYDCVRTSFQCAITKQFMYSVVAERTDNVPSYNDYSEDNREYLRMPLECEHYEDDISHALSL